MTTDFQHVRPAMADVNVIKITGVSQDGKVSVPLNPPESTTTLPASRMRPESRLCSWSTRRLRGLCRYRTDDELFAWYTLPAESEVCWHGYQDEEHECIVPCPGPHCHMPGKKKIQTLSLEQFNGYCLLHAAQDGCLQCVQHWIDTKGVDVHFKSTNQGHNAMDFILWAQKKKMVCDGAAELLISYLKFVAELM